MLEQIVEIAMTDPCPDADSLFDIAIQAIQSTVFEQDQRTFRHHADANSLLHDLRSICEKNKIHQQRLVLCERKIGLFAHIFAPYFDIVGKYGQVRTDLHGWFWGCIGLVFKVASNHVLFLEKIADSFETMAHLLPQYKRFNNSTQRHSIDPTRRSSYVRHDAQLTTLLSYVYADIIQICLELLCIFCREFQGAGLRHRVGGNSAVHVFWRPLDSRFASLEKRLRRHRRWLDNEIKETDSDLIAENRKEYFDFLKLGIETDANGGEEVEVDRMARRLRRVDRVKAWLSNCCAYQDVYEHRSQQRHPSTCTWFLNIPQYCKWRNAPFDERLANDTDNLHTSWHERIVFVQAKLGYGKTFLSGQVIDDLTRAEDLNINGQAPTTAFFHFDAAHMYCTHPNDAFRSIAEQLVHARRHDRSTLDALALLLRKTPEQEKASSDNVIALLSLLLRQHSTFLVMDGIDECSDIELLLTLLPDICRKSDTRVLLFSRPNIKIPLSFQKWASDAPHIISLDESQNALDIETYLTENLNGMADQGFFGISMDRSLIPYVASRSNGVFLWANLLLKYLQTPSLSPDERRAALENIHQLEGLEALYRGILISLDRQPTREKKVAVDIFRWLSLSIRRLCIPGTQVALAITPGQSTTEDQYLANFEESIPHLTGGLVEVTGCSVIFTHRSVKEYLQSYDFQYSPFSLYDEGNVHTHLAAKCISFLANDIPKKPLHRLQPFVRPLVERVATGSGTSVRTESSGDSGYKSIASGSSGSTTTTTTTTYTSDSNSTVPERSQTPTSCFDDDIPFLRYASLCWPIHLTRALADAAPHSPSPQTIRSNNSISNDLFHNTPWLPVLGAFLADRSAVTAWVEASWRYSLPPNVSRLIPLLCSIKSALPPATVEGRELRLVVQELRDLSGHLMVLKNEHGTSLRENPSLIWQMDGGFWPVWDERSIALSDGLDADL